MSTGPSQHWHSAKISGSVKDAFSQSVTHMQLCRLKVNFSFHNLRLQGKADCSHFSGFSGFSGEEEFARDRGAERNLKP